MVSDDRKGGISNISKYLFILLKSLRKLDKYYPNEKEKYLYRCISSKVNLNYDLFNKKSVPYITGNTKTFWGFTSSSPDIKMTYNFLWGEENNKSGTIFTLTGKVWGYDITLFNYYNEKEILIEPERKYKIDEVMPPVNEIIHIRCEIQDNPLILNDNLFNIKNNNNIKPIKVSEGYDIKYLMIGDTSTGKIKIASRFINNKYKEGNHLIDPDYGHRIIKLRNKNYRINIWDLPERESSNSIFYIYTDCAIIVYSITNRNSFEHIPTWIEDFKNQRLETSMIVLVGNKAHKENKREVSYDEGKSLAQKYGIQFFEVSAKTGQNIDELFYYTIDEISKKIEDEFYDLSDGDCSITKLDKKKYSFCFII